MNINSLIKKHFPFPEFNPGQEQLIFDAVEALRLGVKHVIISAPTGTGKSVIATTVHRVMRELDRNHRTTIITGTKGLQAQYMASDKDIFNLMGKKNYMCLVNQGPYNSSGCRMAVSTKNCDRNRCPYVQDRKEWTEHADLRLTNASFQLEAPPSLVMTPETKAKLIVIDECHDIPKHLIAHNTIKLNVFEFFYTRKVLGESFIQELIRVIESYSKMSVGSAFEPNEKQKSTIKVFRDLIESALDDLDTPTKHTPNEIGAVEELQSVSDKLGLFVDAVNGEWILTEYVSKQKLELKPVYAHQVANYGLFRKSDQFIHMSATICGFKQYREDLGITENFVELETKHPFPKENRPIEILSVVPVSGQYDKRKLVNAIDAIISHHGKDNGVIHTVSFKLAEEIKQVSKHARRMVISNDRREILDLMNKHNSGAILLSPSVETGYDFKGDMAKYQIIAKVPFGYIGDPFIKLNMDRSPDWYAREAILRLVQASGRIIRGPDDKGPTYIIDSNVERLLSRNGHIFPDWWLESIVE